jgi:hypothetical protein
MNPTVTVVKLFTIKWQPHQSPYHLKASTNEKLNEVEFTIITEMQDYFEMTATNIANDPTLRRECLNKEHPSLFLRNFKKILSSMSEK